MNMAPLYFGAVLLDNRTLKSSERGFDGEVHVVLVVSGLMLLRFLALRGIYGFLGFLGNLDIDALSFQFPGFLIFVGAENRILGFDV
jgi:hypothetical protein